MINKAIKLLRGKEKPFTPIKIHNDEFINWLIFANAGMLHRGNIYCMKYAIENLPSTNPIVEIGSFCGLSTNVIRYFLNQENKSNKIYCSDKWEFEREDVNQNLPNTKITFSEYSEFVRNSFIRNIKMFSGDKLPSPIEVFSDDFFKLWSENSKQKDVFDNEVELGGPISFAYIDGNHTYEFAMRDFQNVDNFLEKGGFILFDDSADGDDFGSVQVAQEVTRRPDYEIIIKNPNYLLRKK